eukprot:6570495-Pyramimonas_sp.AAC.1
MLFHSVPFASMNSSFSSSARFLRHTSFRFAACLTERNAASTAPSRRRSWASLVSRPPASSATQVLLAPVP